MIRKLALSAALLVALTASAAAQLPGGASSPLVPSSGLFGTRSGNTNVFATTTGTLTNGNCVSIGPNGNFLDAGGPCSTGGGGGTVNAANINDLAWYAGTGSAVSGLVTANSGVLVTSAGGVPSISSTLPSGLTIPSPTLSGTVAGAGTIPNVVLANSSITIAGHSVALGGTQAIACADLSNSGAFCAGTDAAGLTGTLAAARLPAFTGGDVTSSAGSASLAIGATKVVSAMLNTDVFSTAHSWAGQQTFTAPILGTPASVNLGNATALPASALPSFGSGDVSFASGGGAGTIAANAVTLAKLATQATNTILGNATSGSAVPAALAVGTCSAAGSALIWTTNTGFGCNTSITANAVAVGGITGLGANVATLLGGASSGTGGPAGKTSPTFTTPILGAASATSINFGGSTLSDYVAAGSWTPTDGSGASLTFAGVSASYNRVGNMIFASAILTYPVTASGANATVSGLPFSSPNAGYGRACNLTYAAAAGASFALLNQNASTFSFYSNTGANIANSVLTGATVAIMCSYPVA